MRTQTHQPDNMHKMQYTVKIQGTAATQLSSATAGEFMSHVLSA